MTDHPQFRPLYLVEQLSEEIGIPITYAYDDLVFFEHSAVMLQFDGKETGLLHLLINNEAGREEQEAIREQWMQVAQTKNIPLDFSGTFSLEQLPGKEEISVRFD